MELKAVVLERVGTWDSLSRWERSELGKDLRRLGLSYAEIMDMIPVKKSTLATWCRDVELTPEQIEAIRARRAQEPGIPRDTQWRRRKEIEELREIAQELVPELITDPFWVAGLVLYWAEGSKTRNKLSLANTDPRALRLFIRWVRTYLMRDAEFRLALHLHEGNNEELAQADWADLLGMPEAVFHKTFIKPKGTGQRKNNHLHGVCTVRVLRCADAWQCIDAWMQALPAYFSLEKPDR